MQNLYFVWLHVSKLLKIMKTKHFLLFFLMVLPMLAVGQVQDSSASITVVRKGNTYMVGDLRMNKQAYRGYLKNTCPEAYSQFDRGYKTAMAGWGLFAAGPALVGGSSMFWIGASFGYDPNNTPAQERHRVAVFSSNFALTCLGCASFVSGIVCLGVGYGQMHRTTGNLNCNPTTYWTIEKRPNEIGLAWHF